MMFKEFYTELESISERKSKTNGFDSVELALGTKVEMEHTDDPKEAAEIAKDHLRENPKYYSLLAKAGLTETDILKESPDHLVVNGARHSWHEGITFFAFKTPGGKTHIAITHGSGHEFHLQINDINLTDYMRKSMTDFCVYLDHESLAAVIHALKPDIIKDKMSRDEFVFSGRVWMTSKKNYFSFWNSKDSIDSNKSILDKLMDLLKVKYEASLFEFPQNQGDYKPYEEVKKASSTTKDSMTKFMSQVHTLPPGAKKWAMKGLSMRESLLMEDPDSMYVGDPNDPDLYAWESEEVTSVFSVFEDFGKFRYIIAKMDGLKLEYVTTGDKKFDEELGLPTYFKKLPYGFNMTHDILLKPLVHYLHPDPDEFDDVDFDSDGIRAQTEVSGRTWRVNGKDYVSVWNPLRALKNFHTIVDEALRRVGISPEDALYESIDFNGEFKTYDEVTGNTIKKKSKLSPEQIMALMKKQHIDPKSKKLLHLASDSHEYQDEFKQAATKMNMSLAQLKNQITQGD